MAVTEVRLPELGENVASGDLVKLLVAVGDVVAKDQALLELETEKASIEVPSPVAGKITAIHVKEGQKLKVGQPVVSVEESDGKPAGKAAEKAERLSAKAEPKPQPATEAKAEPAAETGAPPPKPEAKPTVPAVEPAAIDTAPATVPDEALEAELTQRMTPAAPSTRRFAREIGVDITRVRGSGPGGRVSVEDIKQYVKARLAASAGAAAGVAVPAEALPDFSRWGEIDRQPMRAVRRATARHLSFAWATVPHVTQYDKADITELEELRKRMGKKAEAAGGKLTMTAIALKIAAAAIHRFPQFAASVDMAREEIIYKKYVHIGVAVDTDRGLLVPVIRDVDRKNIVELSVELTQVAEKARNKKLAPDEMEGAVFTITNLGGIGGTYFSPIVNSPEVAILGICRSSWEPVFRDGQFVPRFTLPLSLSYDHRLVDGADGARFLRWVAESFEQPFLLLMEG